MNDWNEAELNQEESYQAQLVEDVPVKKYRSCLVYGCLISIVSVLLLVVGVSLAGYWFIQGQVNKYTSDQQAKLPVVEYTEEEMAAVEGRIKTFKEVVEKGEMPESLILTTDDLNALISNNEELRGKVNLSIQEGQISGEVSIPTDFITGGKGRYFNASVTFDVSFDNGVLIVTLADATVKGERVPQEIIEGISKENLAKDMYKDPEMAEVIRRFDSLTIEEDKIILTPRLSPDNVEEAEAGSDVDAPIENRQSKVTICDGLFCRLQKSHQIGQLLEC